MCWAVQAALEFLLQTGRQPDILHCHDWSTAGVAQAYWNGWNQYGLWRPKVVFTIHNAEYGLDRIGSAAYYSQRFTTVSPTYAFEVPPVPFPTYSYNANPAALQLCVVHLL